MKHQSFYKKVGPYCLIREIGAGSFARVYRGKIDGKQEDVAIKMISKQNVRNENLSMIEKEIEILAKLDHPNIIKLVDSKRTQNHFYLVFEFCEHGDLDAKNTKDGVLPEKEIRKIIQQLALALEKMHSLRIVHRDLKLANILVSRNFQIKLADFGFAKYTEEDQYLTSYCGTPLTMAPEVLKREKYNDRCDIWSVGVIIYQLLFGRAPFQPPKGGNLNDLIKIIEEQPLNIPDRPEISNQLKELLQQMLQKDFKKRMSCIQFFTHHWLIEYSQYDAQYLKSLCPEKQEQPHDNAVITYHKVSEDINEEELLQNQDDMMNDGLIDVQLKFITCQLRKTALQYLDKTLIQINQINKLSEKIAKQQFKYDQINRKVKQLSLAILLYSMIKQQEINEFMREQVVVLHTTSSNLQLITLRMSNPFQKFEIIRQQLAQEVKIQIQQNQEIFEQFANSGLCVADNIFDEFMQLIIVLTQNHHLNLFDKNLLEEIQQLLTKFTFQVPQVQSVELFISLETGNDMSYYWHLFKLIRVHQQKIQNYIETGIQCENADFNQKIAFEYHFQLEDHMEKIGFGKEQLTVLRSILEDEKISQ
ncbi:hypothetical protein pb186bvf_001372 [Paramecium bursaria]